MAIPRGNCGAGFLQLVFQLGFFDGHVAEFAGVEDVATVHANHKFRVLVARDDLNAGVPALAAGVALRGRLRRRDGCHNADDRAGHDAPGKSS